MYFKDPKCDLLSAATFLADKSPWSSMIFRKCSGGISTLFGLTVPPDLLLALGGSNRLFCIWRHFFVRSCNSKSPITTRLFFALPVEGFCDDDDDDGGGGLLAGGLLAAGPEEILPLEGGGGGGPLLVVEDGGGGGGTLLELVPEDGGGGRGCAPFILFPLVLELILVLEWIFDPLVVDRAFGLSCPLELVPLDLCRGG